MRKSSARTSIVVFALLAFGAMSTQPANAVYFAQVCTGPYLTGVCQAIDVTYAHVVNFSSTVRAGAESYVDTGGRPVKIFTGPDGTGSGFLLVQDGAPHGMNNLYQWHNCWSARVY
jgi:hypothetical protein